MSMGRRKSKQGLLFVETARTAQAPRHRFYEALNKLLLEASFDEHVESLCGLHYVEGGRPSIPPGVYFRMLLLGYFEGIESERGICWRCEDSLSLKAFLGYEPHEQTPDHSTLSRIRTRLSETVYQEVFRFALKVIADKGLLRGKVAGVDSTYLRADASMKGIVRRDSGEGYRAYLKRLAQEAGLGDLNEEELRRFDRKRRGKKTSNADWVSPVDPDAEITKLKDGRTRLAYKAEHVVDMESGAILAAEITPATAGDAESMVDSLDAAERHLNRAKGKREGNEGNDDEPPSPNAPASRHVKELTGDKGYHKASALEELHNRGVRTYIPERLQKGQRNWRTNGGRRRARVVYRNRARTKRPKSKALQRKRGELIERTFAHLCETGGHRRTRLRQRENVSKRYLIQAAGFNLSLAMRQLLGHGTPRQHQDAVTRAKTALVALWATFWGLVRWLSTKKNSQRSSRVAFARTRQPGDRWCESAQTAAFSTGC